MVLAGLTTIASCNYDIISTLQGKKKMHILCIGHGGGSLPLFLASKIQGKYCSTFVVFSGSNSSLKYSNFKLLLK